MQIQFELKMRTALLMHHDNIQGSDAVRAWILNPDNKNRSTPGDDRTPPWTWMIYLYIDDNGNVCLPSEHIMAALRHAGAKMILKKQKTYKELTQTGCRALTPYMTFKNNGKEIPASQFEKIRDEDFAVHLKTVEKAGFKLFMKRARVNQAKTVRVRPRFDNWSISGVLEVDSQDLTKDVMIRLFDFAGLGGMGDWRPSSKTPGPWGMFTTKLEFAK